MIMITETQNNPINIEEIKIMISLVGVILPSLISTAMLITNIILTVRNNNFLKRQSKKENDMESIYSYYLPVKQLLIYINFAYKVVKTENFCIFEDYSNQIKARNEKLKILETYKYFLDNYNNIVKKFRNYEIDKKIENVYEHILFMLLNENIKQSQCSDQYLLPNLDDLVKEIDNYTTAVLQ